MTQAAQQSNLMVGINSAIIPKEGPKTIPVNLIFTAPIVALSVDLSQQQETGKISFVQTIYVDNYDNAEPIFIYLDGATNQRLVVPAGGQEYLPVLSPNPPKFIFATTGAVIVPVQFINVPLPFVSTQGGGGLSGDFQFESGALLVKDAPLEALIADLGGGNALDVNVVHGGSSGGAATPSDGYANPTTATDAWSLAGQYDDFTATWNRRRGMFRMAPFVPFGVRGSVSGIDFTLRNAKAISMLVSVGSVDPGASIILDLRMYDLYYSIQGYSVAPTITISATGLYLIQFGPDLTDLAQVATQSGFVQRVGCALAKEMNLTWTPAVGNVGFSAMINVHNE